MERLKYEKIVLLFINILVLSSDVICSVLEISQRNTTYVWKTGNWGTCYSPSKCGEGRRERHLSCVDSLGLIVLESNCDAIQKPETKDVCFRVCGKHKWVLRWSVTPWSSCIPFNHSTNHSSSSCKVAGAGIARREVNCIFPMPNGKFQIVERHACEYFWDKPDSSMACSFECAQDCIVTETHNVSMESCKLDLCTELPTVPVKTVVVAPDNGGRSCPELSANSSCSVRPGSDCFTQKFSGKEYILKLGNWSPCEPVTKNVISNEENTLQRLRKLSLTPVIGRTRRNLTCIDSQGEETLLSNCDSSTIFASLEQRCLLPVDCEVSPWSEWRVEKEGCTNSEKEVFVEVRSRSRQLVSVPVGNGLPCPYLYESRIINRNLPPCYKYKWFPFEWSECQVIQHGRMGHVEILRPTCGGGVQLRNLTCLRVSDLVPVNEDLCKEPRPNTIQRCKIPCRRNCQVSPWSRWGSCLSYNVTDYLQPIDSGFRKRVRSVLVESTTDGVPCPHLQELDSCMDVEMFSWVYANWSACSVLKPGSTCGSGEKTRAFTCVKWNGNPIGDYMCHHHIPLMMTKDKCRVPCPHDCLLSEWSEWSTCSQPCSSEDHYGEKSRNRTLLAVEGPGGKLCRKQMKEKDLCNLHGCETIKWIPSDWGPCQQKTTPDPLKPFCGFGQQQRELFCTKGEDTLKPHSLCKIIPKPILERECHIPCPIDCVTTRFTEWSQCPSNCNSDADQYRERVIQQEARHGGKPCPSLIEARPCSEKNEIFCLKTKTKTFSSFHWKIGAWDNCTLPSISESCGRGFQIRNIGCADEASHEVEPHKCLDIGQIYSNLTHLLSLVPPAFRLCQITCPQSSCVLSSWTPWTSCDHQYKSRRTRYRELIDDSSENNTCNSRYHFQEEEDCPLLSSELPLEDNVHWMSCIVQESNGTVIAVNGQTVLHSCGTGYRYKVGFQIEHRTGIEPGMERDLCYMDCPVDCQMDVWTNWSVCDVPCGQGYKERQRRILGPANHLGRPCPLTNEEDTEVQRDVCALPCAEFQWSVSGWSDCELFDNHTKYPCGNGTQQRTVLCIDKQTEETVDERRCDPLTRPQSLTDCQIHCPGECVVSPWVTWKQCSEPCSSDNYLEKRREILRHPGPTGSECPSILSRDPCLLNVTCFHHSWSLGDWGSCVLPEGALCGEGVQRRALLCKRSDGRQVDAVHCEKTRERRSQKKPTSKPCYVDCPIDCILSAWSDWDDSECRKCGTAGSMLRTRKVLQSMSDTGQPCTSDLDQRKPCPFRPCYHWNTSDWSSCNLQGADCGHGVRRRLVQCFRYDGLHADKVHCLVTNLTFPVKSWLDPKWLILAQNKREEEPCYVQCPGDCAVSEWSDWSHCHRDCRMGQLVGYQTSSRAILSPKSTPERKKCTSVENPSLLWRTRPCWDSECQFFSWKFRNETLVCERTDGLLVNGGCADEPRPCFPGCVSRFGGACDESTGVCSCSLAGNNRTVVLPHDAPLRCDMLHGMDRNQPKTPANYSAPTSEIHLKYYPDDSQVSFWMYAMISIGTAFVIFVFVTVYLMCRSSIRRRMVSVQRQASVRRRGPVNSEDAGHSPYKC